MPTYNQAGFIRRAIVSLCKQTYKNRELIIINDGSTDKTEEYLFDYLSSLPSDDYFDNDHLNNFKEVFDKFGYPAI
jgi:glycosyltransferase involved in cell wall biosynthesis